MKFRNYAAIVGLTASVAALSTGCATKTSLLQTETQDHTVTVLATCGAGLDDSISAKTKVQLGQGGEISAEALSSVKASLVNDGTLKSEDKLKAFDIFTKCALEMDKRIRDGKPANAFMSSLVGKQWYLQRARYENVVVDQTKEPPYSVKRTAHDVRSDEVRKEEQPISDAYWIRFREDGTVETNFTNRNINADVLFGHGCANRWTALSDGAAVWVQNGWIFPPEPSEEAKFKVTMNGKRLVLERLEGSHQVLVDGDFEAD